MFKRANIKKIKKLKERKKELDKMYNNSDYKTNRNIAMTRYTAVMGVMIQLIIFCLNSFTNNDGKFILPTQGKIMVVAIILAVFVTLAQEMVLFSDIFKYKQSVRKLNQKMQKLKG